MSLWWQLRSRHRTPGQLRLARASPADARSAALLSAPMLVPLRCSRRRLVSADHDRADHQRSRQLGAAHRSVRADHAGRRAGRRNREPAVHVRGVRPPAARRAPLRRGGRHRAAAGGADPVPVRRRRADRARRRERGRRPHARLAGRLPVHRRRGRLPGGRAVLPGLTGAHRDRHVRRGGAAGDAGAVGVQPRLRDRLGRRPNGHRRRRPPADRDGLAAHPRAGGRGRRPRGLPGRVRQHLQPGGRPPARHPHRGHRRARVRAAARRR